MCLQASVVGISIERYLNCSLGLEMMSDKTVERGIVMRCRCGNEIKNVPEHLRNLATWVCQQCTNSAPRNTTITLREEQERKIAAKRDKKAA